MSRGVGRGANPDRDGNDPSPGPLTVLRRPPEGPRYPPVFRLLGSDGVYEVRTSPAGQFVAKVEGLFGVREGFFSALPPVPAALLGRTVEIFKERPDTEAMVAIVYDESEARHRLVWQGAKASSASVEYLPLVDDDRHVVVAEIHSHHRMEAYFSRQDDQAERASGRLYGVVGRVDLGRPRARFRYACGTLPDGSPRFRCVPADGLFSPPAEVWKIVEDPFG